MVRKKYYPKHQWRNKGSGICQYCDICDYLNNEGACRDCYTRAVEREHWKNKPKFKKGDICWIEDYQEVH